ncbi:MAG: Xaa-Pro peptidase family protein [Puniceicoccales bacterium]|jgi:Xaa-Pro aminopeptidase|nr:Xaa-Pro peptidase family protein [Puniceicoccales bacterium]
MAISAPPRDVLLYAAPNTNADMLWFSRFQAGDPLLAFTAKGKKIGAVSLLEVTRAQKESSLDVVLDIHALLAEVRKGNPKAGISDVVAKLAAQYGVKAFSVPPDFPASLYKRAVEQGVQLEIVGEAPFFPKRVVKTPDELEGIRGGNRASSAGFSAVEKILAASEIRGGWLWFEKKKLTSERLHAAINQACLAAGALNVTGLIAAAGDQAVDCHASGYGPIPANQLIVVDIFPRVSATGYFGDMTRTYLKGKASPEQKRLVKTVREAQQLAFTHIKPGVPGINVYRDVVAFFEAQGYKTGFNEKTGYQEGFFHGLGHGLGLDVHEEPGLNRFGKKPLVAGNVVTVEPGLYYIGVGGCRIEDVVVVTADGCELLSKHPYRWEIA